MGKRYELTNHKRETNLVNKHKQKCTLVIIKILIKIKKHHTIKIIINSIEENTLNYVLHMQNVHWYGLSKGYLNPI